MLVDNGLLPLTGEILIEGLDKLVVGKEVDLVLRKDLLTVVSRLRQGGQQFRYLIDRLIRRLQQEAPFEGRLDGFQGLDVEDRLRALHTGVEHCLDLQRRGPFVAARDHVEDEDANRVNVDQNVGRLFQLPKGFSLVRERLSS